MLAIFRHSENNPTAAGVRHCSDILGGLIVPLWFPMIVGLLLPIKVDGLFNSRSTVSSILFSMAMAVMKQNRFWFRGVGRCSKSWSNVRPVMCEADAPRVSSGVSC